jgi:hypothetical protein
MDRTKTAGEVLAKMMAAKTRGEDVTELRKEFQSRTKSFFEDQGVSCTFSDETEEDVPDNLLPCGIVDEGDCKDCGYACKQEEDDGRHN